MNNASTYNFEYQSVIFNVCHISLNYFPIYGPNDSNKKNNEKKLNYSTALMLLTYDIYMEIR
jgi:hypothetical protein